MKKTWARFLVLVAVLGFTFALTGCGKSASADVTSAVVTPNSTNLSVYANLPDVVGDFNVTESKDFSGNIVLKLTPVSAGITEDGFIIQYQRHDYFVAEGQDIVLQSNRRYQILISRVFLTDRGFVIGGENKTLDINADKQDLYDDVLNFSAPTHTILGYLLKPIITANFKNSDILVTPYFSYAPPIVCDELEIIYSGGSPRAPHIPAVYMYSAPLQNGTEFKLPAESYYLGVVAKSRVFDLTHKRVLISAPSNYLGFAR